MTNSSGRRFQRETRQTLEFEIISQVVVRLVLTVHAQGPALKFCCSSADNVSRCHGLQTDETLACGRFASRHNSYSGLNSFSRGNFERFFEIRWIRVRSRRVVCFDPAVSFTDKVRER